MYQSCQVSAPVSSRRGQCAPRNSLHARVWSGAILLWLLQLVAGLSIAQVDRGTVEGFVTDETGGGIANALVTITHLQTQDVLRLRTNSLGRYSGPNLSVGDYRIEVQAQSFQTSIQDRVRLEAQSSVRLDFPLSIGSVLQSVVVQAEAPLVDASNPTLITTLVAKQVEDLPVVNIGGKRNIGQWLQFLPGVNAASTWGARVNGANAGNSEIFLDGAPASQGNVRGAVQETGPDVATVGEFSVVTNSFNAEYGRTGTWFTNIVVKSGTGHLHGSLYDHFANDALNTRSFFEARRSLVRQNDGGFTQGGPIRIPRIYDGRNKTFFFVGQELFFYRSSGGTSLATSPTQAFRNGDFSSLRSASGLVIPIFDPASTTEDGKGGFVRTQFAGNIIPTSRLSPISARITALMPQPNLPGSVSNFILQNARITNTRVTTAKVDHSVTPTQRLSVTTTFQTRPSRWSGQGWGLLLPVDGTEEPKNVRSFDTRINYDSILRPNLLNHLVIGGDGMENDAITSTLGQNWDSNLGITGLPADSGMFPNVTFNGGSGAPLTLGGTNYSRNVSSRLSLNDNLTLVLGRHTLKLGVNLIRERYADLEGGVSAGVFGFSNLTTSQPNSPSFTQWGSSFASFLLGEVNNTNTTTISDLGWRINYAAAFVQDEWRATSRFTVSYGLRFERYPGVYEHRDRATSFNGATPNPAAGGIPGALTFTGFGPGRIGNRSFSKTWNGFAPRLGLAFELNRKTVIRASGGLFYAPGVTPRIDATGFTATPSFSSPDGFSSVYNWANPWPTNWTRPPSLDPSFANGQTVSNLGLQAAHPPQIATWTASIQKQFGRDTTLEASYVGSKSTHLEIGGTLGTYLNVLNPDYLSLGNLLNQSAGSSAAQAIGLLLPFSNFLNLPRHTIGQALRPFPQYASITMPYSPEGMSSYHALQLKASKRYSESLLLLAFYTRSKLMTDDDFAPIDLGEGPGNIQNPLNRAAEYSVSQDDYPNTFGVSFSYALPFGMGKALIHHPRGLAHLVTGWQVAGSVQRQSGQPLSIMASTALAQFGFPAIRANYIGGQNVNASTGSFDPAKDRYLNAAAFASPGLFQFGNTGRVLNWVRGPAISNEALSLQRKVAFTEKVSAMLRADATNPFNIVRWNNPNTNVSDANFGVISSAQAGRVVQLTLQVSF